MMLSNVHWLGHDTFKISGTKTIYTDPFNVVDPDRADIILITHEHYDHCSPQDVQKLRGPETIIVAPQDCVEKLAGPVKTVRPGDTLVLDGVVITAIPAYNMNKQFHTKDRGWVGYIVTTDDQTIYLAGDTDLIPEMSSLPRIDIALLPVSGTYVMTADEAAQAARVIKPGIAVPMHYGSIVGGMADAERFAEILKGSVPVVILKEERQ